jgi:hypothetical protein
LSRVFLSRVPLNADDTPLQIGRWKGVARLHAGDVEIEKGTLESPGGVFEVRGTASLAQVLDFKLTGGPAKSTVYTITGTLEEPRVTVSSAGETQAQLKP